MKPETLALLNMINAAVVAGTFYFGTQKEFAEGLKLGLIEVNTDPASKNAEGKMPARLTPAGIEALPKTDTTENTSDQANGGAPAPGAAPATPTAPKPPTFVIARGVAPAPITRGFGTGSGRESSLPFDQLEVGDGMFIPLEAGKDPKAASKAYGSTVANRNKQDATKFFTSRGVADGAAMGFVGMNEDGTPNPDLYKGVRGTAIYRRDPSEKKVRAVKVKPPAQTAEQIAAAAAAAAAPPAPPTFPNNGPGVVA